MTKAIKIDASSEYVAQHAAATKLLASIQAMVQDLPAADGERIHWGHVGNIGYINTKLEEVAAFIKSIDAVREIAKHQSSLG